MKREIKFRGKRVDNKEWVYGYFVGFGHIIIFNSIDGNKQNDFGSRLSSARIISETVCQFTGLKDKNGVEIYEWDIVLVNGVISANIVWANQSFVLKKKSDFMEVERIYSFRNELEVIGNIHDNPELLK